MSPWTLLEELRTAEAEANLRRLESWCSFLRERFVTWRLGKTILADGGWT